MKAKKLIKILQQNPEADVFTHSQYDECFTPLVKRGKIGENKQVIVIYSDSNKEHISDDYVDFFNG